MRWAVLDIKPMEDDERLISDQPTPNMDEPLV
jgi:hypothetical protein